MKFKLAMTLLIIWGLLIAICAIVGFAFIVATTMKAPIWAAASGGVIFLILTIPIVIFTDGAIK